MKNKKILIIIIAAVVVVIGGIAAFLLLSGGEPKEVELVYFNYSLDEQYSNLLLPEGSKAVIAKYRVHIRYSGEDTQKLLEDNRVMLQNNIDEILRSTKPEDISKTNGKEKLRGRIRNMIIDRMELDDTVISDVFLDPFVVQ